MTRLIRESLLTCIVVVFALAGPVLASPEVPGPPQNHPVLLVGGVIHPASGPVIRGGSLLFSKGKIVAVGRDLAVPEDAIRVELDGKHVYPGLIDASTQIGLVEINAVRASVDMSETGSVNPNVKAQIAFNPDSELVPVTRSNGVLAVLTVPQGGLISGKSALMMLDGWTWEDMALKPDVGMHVNWPRISSTGGGRGGRGGSPTSGGRSPLDPLRETFDKARAYWTAQRAHESNGTAAPDFDARWEAMVPVLEGKLPIIASANGAVEIQSAVAFAREQGIRLIIQGGYEAPDCAELLKRHDVPVIVAGVNRLPRRADDPYDAAFSVPRRLHEAGVRFCISGAERTANTRNLPYHAGAAAAHGLPRDEALRSITLYPAQILGAGDRIGSLEAGKDATLIITDGDPLEIPTHVEAAYIQGRPVDLSDRQKRLWAKYGEKYRRLGLDGSPEGEEPASAQ